MRTTEPTWEQRLDRFASLLILLTLATLIPLVFLPALREILR